MERQTPFFRPGGTLDPRAESYLRRSADAVLLQALLDREYVYLLDSRQKGKSSMVARAIVGLRERGVRTVKLDLQRVGANVSPEQWYAGLLAGVGDELGLSAEVFGHWAQARPVGPMARWIGTLGEVVLPAFADPIVVFVDEVDFVRALPFSTDEFFAGIRDCYNRRAESEAFGRLTFCLVGVATPSQLIRHPKITPFNIGRRLDLTDFTLEETRPFAYALDARGVDGAALVERIHYWANGHPYLTQLLCSLVADAPGAGPETVDRIVRETLLNAESRAREPNLADVERRLLEPDLPAPDKEEQRCQVLDAYGQVLRGRTVEGGDDAPLVATLRLSGVCVERHGRLALRNRLYSKAFDDAWRKANLPEAELRRQRRAAWKAALSTGAVALTIVASIGALAIRNAQLAADRERLLRRAEALGNEAARQAYVTRMNLMDMQGSDGLRRAALLDLTGAYQRKGWEWHRWNLLLNGQLSTLRFLPTGGLLAFGPHGQLVAEVTVDPSAVRVCYSDGTTWTTPPAETRWIVRLGMTPPQARAYTARVAPLFRRLKAGNTIAVDASPDGSQIAYYDIEDRAYRLVTAAGITKTLISPTDRPNNILGVFSYDGSKFAILTADGRLRCYDTETGRALWDSPCREPIYLSFSPDGSLVAVALNEEAIPIFDAADGRQVALLEGHTAPVRSVEFSKSGKLLLSASQDGTARLWSVPQRKTLQTFTGHRDLLMGAALSPDGRRVATCANDGEVRLWDVHPPPATAIVVRVSDEMHRLVESPRNELWTAGSKGGFVASFDPDTAQIAATLPLGTIADDSAIAADPDGRNIACFGPDGTVRLLDVRTLRERQRWDVGSMQPGPLQISQTGLIAAGFKDGTLLLLQPGSPDVRRLEGHAERIRSLDFQPGGKLLASASMDRTVRIWEVDTGKLLREWAPDSPGTPVGVQFSHDGRLLACANYDNTVAVLNMRGGPAKVLHGHSHRVFGARFSPDDTRILSYGYDGTARLWDTRKGTEIAVLRHDSWVSSARFSPDGERIVTASADKTIRIWDGRFGDEYMVLRDHTEAVFDAAFTADGKSIVSAANDGTVRVWRSK